MPILDVTRVLSPGKVVPADLAQHLADLEQALAPLLQRPSAKVHLMFEPPAAGHIALGGQLR